jgi:hypothetical protein
LIDKSSAQGSLPSGGRARVAACGGLVIEPAYNKGVGPSTHMTRTPACRQIAR